MRQSSTIVRVFCSDSNSELLGGQERRFIVENHTDDEESERLPSSDCTVPILRKKSELKDRIREIVAGEAVAAFARRCGITESLVRKYLGGSQPSAENLVLLASAGGVSVEWLATGRGIRRAVDMRRAEKALRDGAFRAIDGESRPLTAEDMASSLPRRLAALAALIEGLESPKEQAALLDEFLSRAQNAAELHALKQAVAELRAAQKKTA